MKGCLWFVELMCYGVLRGQSGKCRSETKRSFLLHVGDVGPFTFISLKSVCLGERI